MQIKKPALGGNSKQARAITRRILFIFVFLFSYIFSFYVLRKTVVLDFLSIDSKGGGTSLVLHYFSKHQRSNTLLYFLFYPIHGLMFGGDEGMIEQAERKIFVPHNSNIYINNLDELKRRQVVGFSP